MTNPDKAADILGEHLGTILWEIRSAPFGDSVPTRIVGIYPPEVDFSEFEIYPEDTGYSHWTEWAHIHENFYFWEGSIATPFEHAWKFRRDLLGGLEVESTDIAFHYDMIENLRQYCDINL